MLISIIGPAYAGKDTFADHLETCWNGRCHLLRTGKECRDKFGEAFMAKCAKPYAPDETESYVRRRFVETWNEHLESRYPAIFIGNPRTAEQAEFIMDLVGGAPVLVMLLTIDRTTQFERFARRDGSEPHKHELGLLRIQQDPRQLDAVLSHLREYDNVFVTTLYSSLFAKGASWSQPPSGRA